VADNKPAVFAGKCGTGTEQSKNEGKALNKKFINQ